MASSVAARVATTLTLDGAPVSHSTSAPQPPHSAAPPLPPHSPAAPGPSGSSPYGRLGGDVETRDKQASTLTVGVAQLSPVAVPGGAIDAEGGVDYDDDDAFWRDEQALALIDEMVRSVKADRHAQCRGRNG